MNYIRRTPVGYWKDSQNVKYAIEWFIDEKLEGKYEHLEKLSRKELYEYLKPYGMTGIVKLYKITGKDFIEIYKR